MKNKLFDFSNKVRVFRVITAHLTAMFAVLIIVCFIIDRVNTAMEFMTSNLSKWCIAILAVLALIGSILTICALWVNPDKRKRQKQNRNRR
jgi:phage shock protein PspC (stress-responsive transcriptional regulator)